MPISIRNLRRWFGWGAVAVAVVVSAAYFYAHWSDIAAGHNLPGKMGLQIQQTANGFMISKSEQGRTIFTVRASNAVQYREGGQAVLHNVAITVYGKEHDRFDQIYGKEFLYDKQRALVTARGEVQIDLQANPEGARQPDQANPKELKNPVHLRTTGLVFNQNTGDAYTPERVDFSVQQATGFSVGATYNAKEGLLDMHSQVHVVLNGASGGMLDASHGTIRREPRVVDLDRPHMVRGPETYDSDHATIYLRADNTVDHMVGTGHVKIHMEGDTPIDARSDRADVLMVADQNPAGSKSPPATQSSGKPVMVRDVSTSSAAGKTSKAPAPVLAPAPPRNLLRTATLTGNVHVESHGPQPMEGDSGRATFNFVGKNILATARAEENVRIVQHHVGGKDTKDTDASNSGKANSGSQNSNPQTSRPQDIIVNAPIIDFVIGDQGRSLKSAVTSGPPKITIVPSDGGVGESTVITARKFTAKFGDESRLQSVHGAPEARIVNSAPNQGQRISTSEVLDVAFLAAGGIESVIQTGSVAYVDGDRKAWGDRARYNPADQMLYLNGSPRFVQSGMTTTAVSMRMDRGKGDAYADGNVKSTYSDLKQQPDGALLASSDPIHITAISMVSHRDPGVATYTGNARLWQNSSVVQAPIIVFDRDARSVVANGTPDYRVSTVFMQTDRKGKDTPVHIISDQLRYYDSERRAHFEGKVVAKSEDATLTSDRTDVFWLPASSSSPGQKPTPGPSAAANSSESKGGGSTSSAGAGKQTNVSTTGISAGQGTNQEQGSGASSIDKIIADGSVVMTQPKRRGVGTHLTYTASDDRFVLVGNPPSIFDAEHGKVTGDSLTFYKRDDRVLVEGKSNSPAFTESRVAR